jgi:hypothetical protein
MGAAGKRWLSEDYTEVHLFFKEQLQKPEQGLLSHSTHPWHTAAQPKDSTNKESQ